MGLNLFYKKERNKKMHRRDVARAQLLFVQSLPFYFGLFRSTGGLGGSMVNSPRLWHIFSPPKKANEITFDLFPCSPPPVLWLTSCDSSILPDLFIPTRTLNPPVFSYIAIWLLCKSLVRKTRAKWRQPTAVMHTCEHARSYICLNSLKKEKQRGNQIKKGAGYE